MESKYTKQEIKCERTMKLKRKTFIVFVLFAIPIEMAGLFFIGLFGNCPMDG